MRRWPCSARSRGSIVSVILSHLDSQSLNCRKVALMSTSRKAVGSNAPPDERPARSQCDGERGAIVTLHPRRCVEVRIGLAIMIVANHKLMQVSPGPAHRPEQNDVMLGDPFEHLAQIQIGITVVEQSGADETVDASCALATGIRAGEQVIAPAQDQRSNRALGTVVVNLDAAVVAIAGECAPTHPRILDGPREFGLRRYHLQRRRQPGMQRIEQWPGALLPHASSQRRQVIPMNTDTPTLTAFGDVPSPCEFDQSG